MYIPIPRPSPLSCRRIDVPEALFAVEGDGQGAIHKGCPHQEEVA